MDDASLADLLCEKEEDITRLKKYLEEKDEKLAKAGELGIAGMEQNAYLEEMLERTQQDHLKIVEEYEQEKYSLENKLELMTKMKAQLEANLHEETQRWKSEMSRFQDLCNKKHSDEVLVLKRQLEESRAQLQQEKLTSLQRLDTIESKDTQIKKLQNEFRQRHVSLNDTIGREAAELTSENCDLKLKLQELEMNEHELSQMIAQLKETLDSSRNSEENLRQAKEDIEREASSYHSSLESCREECRELQAELDLLKFQPNDPDSRGNSLFAEVEDKRVQAEKNLVRWKSQYKCMQAQNEQLKHYTLKLKMNISGLLETRSRTTDQRHVRSLEESLSVARSDNSKLMQKLKSLQEKLHHVRDQNIPELTDVSDSSAIVQFFKNELKGKRSEIERLTEELRLNEIYLMIESKKVSSLERELYDLGRQLDATNSAKFKLQIDIDRLKMKCGEEVKVKVYQHKYTTEKINKDAPETTGAEPAQQDHAENKENEQPSTVDPESVMTTSPENIALKEMKPNLINSDSTSQQGESSRQPLTEKRIDFTGEDSKEASDSKNSTEKHSEPVDSSQSVPVKVHKIDKSRVTTAADCKQQ